MSTGTTTTAFELTQRAMIVPATVGIGILPYDPPNACPWPTPGASNSTLGGNFVGSLVPRHLSPGLVYAIRSHARQTRSCCTICQRSPSAQAALLLPPF